MLKYLKEAAIANLKIKKYQIRGHRPWTDGYSFYREKAIKNVLKDRNLLDCFENNRPLPPGYGYRLDERIVEYPWLLTRLGLGKGSLLDAGSALNHQYILDTPVLKNRTILIYNLSQENVLEQNNTSYAYGDLRNTILENESFDEIICISTLEHIGMDNTLLYSKDHRFKELKKEDYKIALKEFRRLLKMKGRLFITVPYGRYENHGWLQQFDASMVKEIVNVFQGLRNHITYYKYFNDGWQIVSEETCADSSYFDINNNPHYEGDYVAAARAVACIEMVK